MSAEDRLQRDLWAARQGAAASTAGSVRSVNFANGTATVDSAGVIRVLPWAGPAPFVGARVRIAKLGQQWFCQVAGEGASFGVVQSVGSSLAEVVGDDGVTYWYPFPSGASLSNGHVVALDHARQLVLFRVSANPTAVDPIAGAAPPSSSIVTKTFKPTNSGNWYTDGGRWDSQYVEISLTRSAYYFYGKQIDDTIPDSATIRSGSIYLRELWDKVPGTPSQFGTHGYAARPATGPLTITGSLNASGTGTIPLDSTTLNALKNGSAYGIGFKQNTGWRRFDTYVRSGALTISWET